jgi:hypothetical protein
MSVADTWRTLAPIEAFSAHGSAVLLRVEDGTVVVLVEDADENLRLGGSRGISAVARRHGEGVVASRFAVDPAGHAEEAVDGSQREDAGSGGIVAEGVFDVAVAASSLSTALTAITTVLMGMFSATEVSLGVMNSGDMSFTSFRIMVT